MRKSVLNGVKNFTSLANLFLQTKKKFGKFSEMKEIFFFCSDLTNTNFLLSHFSQLCL